MSAPDTYTDKDGDLWVRVGDGQLAVLDNSGLNALAERTVTFTMEQAQAYYGPLCLMLAAAPLAEVKLPAGLDYSNEQLAGATGNLIQVTLPRERMSRWQALIHAAWLVSLADPDGTRFPAILREVQQA